MKLKNLLLLTLMVAGRAQTLPETTAIADNKAEDTCDSVQTSTFKILYRQQKEWVCIPKPVITPEQGAAEIYAVLMRRKNDEELRQKLTVLLEDKDIDPNGSYHGIPHLLNAVKLNLTIAVELLLQNGANMYWQGTQPTLNGRTAVQTPIADAIMDGHIDIIRLFLQHGFKASHVFGKNITVIQVLGYAVTMAAKRNGNNKLQPQHREILNLFVSYGANIDAKDSRGNTQLYVAIQNGHWQFARALFDAGASVTQAMIDLAAKKKMKLLPDLKQRYEKQRAAESSKTKYALLAAIPFMLSTLFCCYKPRRRKVDKEHEVIVTHHNLRRLKHGK